MRPLRTTAALQAASEAAHTLVVVAVHTLVGAAEEAGVGGRKGEVLAVAHAAVRGDDGDVVEVGRRVEALAAGLAAGAEVRAVVILPNHRSCPRSSDSRTC